MQFLIQPTRLTLISVYIGYRRTLLYPSLIECLGKGRFQKFSKDGDGARAKSRGKCIRRGSASGKY